MLHEILFPTSVHCTYPTHITDYIILYIIDILSYYCIIA